MAEKDARTYIRVHDGMPDHPKVDGLSDAAFRLLVTTWCWCSRHHTDGRVPAATWAKRKKKVRDELIDARLAELNDDGSVQVHDYTDWQRTAEEIQALLDAKAAGGTLGNHKRWHVGRGVTDPSCDHCTDHTSDRSTDRKTIAPRIANASQNVAIDIDIDIAKGKNTATPDGFAEFWAAYPRKTDKGHARKAWDKALKKTDAQAIIAAAAAYAATNPDPKFTAHPTTWLNGERWDDEQPRSLSTERPKTYWTPQAPPREVADNPAAYSAWYAEQAAKKRATS